MKKTDIIREISKKTNFTLENTQTAIDAFIDVVSEAMKSGEDKIVLKGIGTFKRKVRSARTCRNPQTGGTVEVGEKVVYTFKPSGSLIDEINE